ncbi:MAG: hypothetical protein HYZ73_04900 [Elusimicrobia bacterium]|nr:hypothetical protein [Elusimicrobiota bacterium]
MTRVVAVVSSSEDTGRFVSRRATFNAHAHADPRVETVMLTVRDGITLARKR